MSRIVSVYLPRWPILRMLAAQAKNRCEHPVAPDEPFVLIVAASGGPRISALNKAAADLNLAIGEPLADARAKAGFLQVRAAEPTADDVALQKLALWATRYTPTAAPWGEDNGADGFFLDIEGSAHLFGGEDELIADLAARLQKNFGLPARIAVTDTPGSAWALSHYHKERLFVLPSRQDAVALAPLPIAGLRLTPHTRATLHRLGLKTIGALLDKPRAPFAARFPAELLRRVDQALGRVDEPLVPVIAPPVYHSLRYLLEPIFTQEAIVAYANRLMQMLGHVLARDNAGARSLRLSLYNVDGAVEIVDIGLTQPTRDAAHVTRLVNLKLEALAGTHDAGFGFEAIGLAVTCAEPMPARQTEFAATAGDHGNSERCAALIDALRQRLGPQSVRCFAPVASHLPERAEILPPLTGETSAWPAAEQARPLLVLPRAEPADDVLALIPEGPPRRFRWRGVTHEIKGAEGPERIAGEWWRPRNEPTRDYYLVENSDGQRFWLYREGVFGRETADARWFVHGLFA